MGVVSKTDSEIYVLTSIDKDKITVFCNALKMVVLLEISKVRYPVEKSLPLCKGDRKCKKTFQSFLIASCFSLVKRTSSFLKYHWQLFFAIAWLAIL